MNAEKLHKLLDCEIDKIAAKPELNDATLANLYKLVDVKKDLAEIMKDEMEMDSMEMGNSNRGGNSYGYYDGNSYRRGGGNSNRMYARGGSSRRGYGYSMDGGSDDMFDCLEEAMMHASSEQEREAIRQTMMKLDK